MFDNIILALNALRANKMRSLLTMLGIIIGIASVIGITTIGDSLMGYINSTMADMGASNISVYITRKDSDSNFGGGLMFGPASPEESDLITDDMLNELRTYYGDQISYISVSETVSTTSMTDSNDNNYSLTVYGTNADTKAIDSVKIVDGRFITDSDNTKVCVISEDLVEGFYNNQSPIGQTINLTINNQSIPFYIVGVYQASSDSTSGILAMMQGTKSSNVYIPLSVAKQLTYGSDGYQTLTVVPSIGVDTNTLMSHINVFLNQYYSRNEAYEVATMSLENMLSSMNSMMNSVQIAIACIAAISLLVGGIGVMNIMLVSITERTREIGTRVALGAKSSDIRLQFIVESMIICLIGGLIGMGLGIGLASIGTNLLGFPAQPSLDNCLIAIFFSMGIGVFFGYYPANKAAKLNPIDALRYE